VARMNAEVTRLNRVVISLYALAQSLDESRFRELRLENIAINSKTIGQVITQSAEFSIPILNTWYNISSSARDLYRNSLSTKDIYKQVEGNTMLKKPNQVQALYYFTRAFFQNYAIPALREKLNVVQGSCIRLRRNVQPHGAGIFQMGSRDS